MLSVQLAPTSSDTVIVTTWVSTLSTDVGKVTSPDDVGVDVPRSPSLSLDQLTVSQSDGTSTSETDASKVTKSPETPTAPSSGAVMEQTGAVLGGPTVRVMLSLPFLPVVSVAVRVRKCSPSERFAAPANAPSLSGSSSILSTPSKLLSHSTANCSAESSPSLTEPSKTMSWSL